jgi:hypothetical protein
MLTNAAGPRWSASVGKLTPVLSDEECKSLVAAGVAEPAEAEKARKAEAAAENAAEEPAVETAALPPARRGGRRAAPAAE